MTDLATIQIPALIAIVALILEGLATFSAFAGLFQVVPILASIGAVYFAWSGGYYFLAVLYLLAGLLAFGSFFSVRLIANIPSIGIYLLILFVPNVSKGPQADLFATIQYPAHLLALSLILIMMTIFQAVRFVSPQRFILAALSLAVVLAATCSEMLSESGWPMLQRVVSFGVGFAAALAGYLYYRAALAWREYKAPVETPLVEQAEPQDPKVEEELKEILRGLERFRTQHGYRLRWLEVISKEVGVSRVYEELVHSGEFPVDNRPLSSSAVGPQAPVRGDGLSVSPAELLGVSRTSSLEEVKESYQRIAAFFNHEWINQLSAEGQKIARRMAAVVGQAYRAISKS